jgi:alkylated DNA repair dioxygenase AlkB
MIDGVIFAEHFLKDSQVLFENLKGINWDERMAARKTASFGVAYNYSQMQYPFAEMPQEIKDIALGIDKAIGFQPNNCLINFYLDGKSKMGFHSDQIDILEENTGVAIVSLGETRILRFRNILNPEQIIDYPLPSGSLIYMAQEVQSVWQHAIPVTDTLLGRMSLTFRKIK